MGIISKYLFELDESYSQRLVDGKRQLVKDKRKSKLLDGKEGSYKDTGNGIERETASERQKRQRAAKKSANCTKCKVHRRRARERRGALMGD